MSKKAHEAERELRRLRRENAYLRHRVEVLSGEIPREGVTERVLSDRGRAVLLARSGSYLGYLILLLKKGRGFRLFDRAVFALRRLLSASRVWRFFRNTVFVVGMGARLLTVLGVGVILLPAALLFSLVAVICGAFSRRKRNRFFGKRIEGQTLYLLFSPSGRKGNYFRAMTDALSGEGVVLLVSRSLAECGLAGVAQKGPNVYAVHTSCYFSLARRFSEFSPRRIIRMI